METEQQNNQKLQEFLSVYTAEFSQDFNSKVMKACEQNKNHSTELDRNWNVGFKRLLIPAAAVLLLLISYNLYKFKSLTPEVINGNSLFSSNSAATLSLILSDNNQSN
jgi:hypothetical protein